MHLARVGVRVIVLVVDVVCLMLVLSALVFFLLYVYSFRSQFSVVGGILFTKSPPLQCALAWRECTIERRGSSCHIENEFYCFLSGYNRGIDNQRRYILLVLETRVAGSDPSISNELQHRFDLLGQDGVPTS